jgi:hypothetical protein
MLQFPEVKVEEPVAFRGVGLRRAQQQFLDSLDDGLEAGVGRRLRGENPSQLHLAGDDEV